MDTDYADDMAVMDNTEGGLQESTDLTLTTALMLGWRTPKRHSVWLSVNVHPSDPTPKRHY